MGFHPFKTSKLIRFQRNIHLNASNIIKLHIILLFSKKNLRK